MTDFETVMYFMVGAILGWVVWAVVFVWIRGRKPKCKTPGCQNRRCSPTTGPFCIACWYEDKYGSTG